MKKGITIPLGTMKTKEEIIISTFRTLTKLFEKFGFYCRPAMYFRNLTYDWIDYAHGPSQTAERFAEKDGYWNLTAAEFFLSSTFHYKKDEWKKKLLRPIIYKKYQVRKY